MSKTFRIVDGDISDGYHTFDELYEHRVTLWIALCRVYSEQDHRMGVDHYAWKSRKHSDGDSFPGWFVLGIGYEAGEQITYHIPDSRWDECDFALELPQAPKFDGHTSADVLTRIRRL